MSLRTELERAAHRAGGSTKTRSARAGTAREYADWCREHNIQTRRIPDMKSRQVEKYVESLRDQGISQRTIQNRMSHLRSTVAEGGGRSLPSNSDLGLAGTRRPPARTAMSAENYDNARDALAERGSAGERAALALQRELGLRAGEAIQSPKSLDHWEKQLERGERVHVIHGTKGGRGRFSAPADQGRALAAVREARAACRSGRLVAGATLQAARSRYERECAAVGLSGAQAPHSARYAYAQDRLAAYDAAGYVPQAAAAAAAQDLGHGSGRARWIRQIYSA